MSLMQIVFCIILPPIAVILCLILPPLAFLDTGFGSIVIVTLLWLFGWIPGVIAALIIVNGKEQ